MTVSIMKVSNGYVSVSGMDKRQLLSMVMTGMAIDGVNV